MHKFNILRKIYSSYFLYLLIFKTEAKEKPCINNLYHVNHFKLTHSDFSDSLEQCTTVLVPRRKHRLLMNLTKASLLDGDILEIKTDSNVHVFRERCQNCLVDVISKKVHVRFYRHRPFNSACKPKIFNSARHKCVESTFRLEVKSFNPHKCEVPKTPSNGYFIGKNRSIGAQIKFQCHSTYFLIGNTNAVCTFHPQLGIPTWNASPPACALKCSFGPKLLENDEDIIFRNDKENDCHWIIKRDYVSVIHLQVQYISLSFGEVLHVSSPTYSIVFTSEPMDFIFTYLSLPVSVVYSGSNSNTFLLEYKVHKVCPQFSMSNGYLFSSHGTNMSVPGMSVFVECHVHYKLVGKNEIKCLENGMWDAPLPLCLHSENQDEKILKRFPRIVKRNQNGIDTSILKKIDFPKDPDEGKHMNYKSSSLLKKSDIGTNLTTDELITSISHTTSKSTAQSVTNPIPTILSVTIPSNLSGSSYEPVNTSGSVYHSSGIDEDMDEVDRDTGRVQYEGSINFQSNKTNKTQISRECDVHCNRSGQVADVEDIFIEYEEGVNNGSDEVWFDWTEMEILGLNIVFFGLVLMGSVVLIVTLIVIVTFLLYRKKYPVRLGLGRSFDTFENPIYSRVHMRSPVKCFPGASQMNAVETTDKESSSHGDESSSPQVTKTVA